MSTNRFLANEASSLTATKLSAWDNVGAVGEKIPANVPTNPDGSAQAQALTETQLRSAPVETELSSAQFSALMPTAGASLEATQLLIKAVLDLIKLKTDNLDVALSTRTKPSDVQNIRSLSATDVVSINGTVPVSGAFYPATQPISNSIESSSNGTITSVASSVASFSVLAANVNRKGFIILNEGTSIIRIAFAATASAASTTLILNANQSYFSTQLPVYRGVISAISNSTNSTLRITELA
jgi:hypothetical protein